VTDPIRKDSLPSTPPSEWEHFTWFPHPDGGGDMVPGQRQRGILVRRRITYGDWEPVRPDRWADEPETPPSPAPAEAPGPSELTADEARDLADELGLDLYRAQDALAFVGECCDIADREQRPITTADVREWLKGARCTRQIATDTSGPARGILASVLAAFPDTGPDGPAVRSWLLPAELVHRWKQTVGAGGQRDEAEATVTRVINLHEQWVKAGPPPLGASMARWWDKRLVEHRNAIQPPQEQPETDDEDHVPGPLVPPALMAAIDRANEEHEKTARALATLDTAQPKEK